MMTPGRPKINPAESPEEIYKKATFLLDMVAFLSYYSSRMPNLEHSLMLVRKRIEHQVNQLDELSKELGDLIEPYNRCLDLMDQVKRSEQELNDLIALAGKETLEGFKKKYEYDADWDFLLLRDPQQMRENMPLWKAIRNYLQVVNNGARVPEILEFMKVVKIPGVTRQAVESALKRHPQVFEPKKVGRERKIFLRQKGA